MIIKKAPWKFLLDHPEDYNGFTKLSIIHYEADNQTYQHVGVVNNIVMRVGNVLKVSKNKRTGILSFVDFEDIDFEDIHFIMDHWKEDIPVQMFMAKHNIVIPPRAVKRIPVCCIVRTVGPVYFYDLEPTEIKKKKVWKMPELLKN